MLKRPDTKDLQPFGYHCSCNILANIAAPFICAIVVWLRIHKLITMTPPVTTHLDESQTRQEIDSKLQQAGWEIQDKKRLNLMASLGVAVREMDTSTGPADYMLFVDGKACGIIEAKREGTLLGSAAERVCGANRMKHSHLEWYYFGGKVNTKQPLHLIRH